MHAFSLFLLAVMAVSDVLRMWSLHQLAIPLGSFVVLAGMWVVFAVPGALAGRYLGSQSRPLFAMIDLRWLWLIGILAFLLALFIHVRGRLISARAPWHPAAAMELTWMCDGGRGRGAARRGRSPTCLPRCQPSRCTRPS